FGKFRRSVEALRDGVEFERDTHQALKQRVVKFPAEAYPFSEDQRELTPELSDPEGPGAPNRRGQRKAYQDVKEPGLIEARGDRNRPPRVALSPVSSVASDVDVNRVLPSGGVGVGRLPGGSRVTPAAVESVQPVAESGFQRICQLGDCVADFQFGRARRE